jgi:hypothetical protein
MERGQIIENNGFLTNENEDSIQRAKKNTSADEHANRKLYVEHGK